MKFTKSGLVAGFLTFAFPFLQDAAALQEPKPIATDHRIQTLRYNENEVFSFVGHYGYQTIIEFAPDEEVATVSVGDSIAWQVTPLGSRLFLKPVEQDATTNMTILTNKRMYQFELHAEEAEDIRDKSMIFVLRFVYPGESDRDSDMGGIGVADTGPDLSDPDVKAKLNFNYSIVGPDIISPIRIFDDGEFTYFEFRDKNGEIPAFFEVDSAGNEHILNFRKEGNYIVVEHVSSRYTLRHGSDVICVFNDALPPGPKPVPLKEKSWYSPL